MADNEKTVTGTIRKNRKVYKIPKNVTFTLLYYSMY